MPVRGLTHACTLSIPLHSNHKYILILPCTSFFVILLLVLARGHISSKILHSSYVHLHIV